MIFAVDVSYKDDVATANGIVFAGWSSRKALKFYSLIVEGDIPPYTSGQFSARELPIILALLSKVKEDIDVIIIDGYVYKDEGGMGLDLWKRLGKRYAVVGIAKSESKNTECIETHRRKAKKPIYISACGIGLTDVVKKIKAMHGEHRIPTLIKRVDRQKILAPTAVYSWEEIFQLPLSEENLPLMLPTQEQLEQPWSGQPPMESDQNDEEY